MDRWDKRTSEPAYYIINWRISSNDSSIRKYFNIDQGMTEAQSAKAEHLTMTKLVLVDYLQRNQSQKLYHRGMPWSVVGFSNSVVLTADNNKLSSVFLFFLLNLKIPVILEHHRTSTNYGSVICRPMCYLSVALLFVITIGL